MVTGTTITFGPHVVEIRYSPTGSYSPWHAEVYRKRNEYGFCTSDVAYFVRVDDKDIYKVEYSLSDVTNEFNRIARDYDFYPAEMEEEFKNYLASDDLKIQPPLEDA